jgi:hypothetical protein
MMIALAQPDLLSPLPRTGGEGRVRGRRAERRANKNQRGPHTPTHNPTLTRGGVGVGYD